MGVFFLVVIAYLLFLILVVNALPTFFLASLFQAKTPPQWFKKLSFRGKSVYSGWEKYKERTTTRKQKLHAFIFAVIGIMWLTLAACFLIGVLLRLREIIA